MYNDIPFANFYFDTLVADSLIDENVKHSLNYCLERRDINFGAYDTELWPYTNKDEKKKKSYKFVPPSLLVKYLGYDVDGDKRLQLKQEKELDREEMTEIFFNVKMPSLKYITDMEYRGVRMNKKLIQKASEAVRKKQEELQEQIVKITGRKDFNPNSPKQVIDYMVEAGYPFAKLKIKQTKTGFSTSAEELNKFIKYKKYAEFPKLLLDIKKLTKIKGTYIDGKSKNGEAGTGGMLQYLDENNRVHANFNIHTAVTGRQSCSRPSLQVWPRPIAGLPNTRQFVLPKKNWKLFSADYSALEMYVVAALSQDSVLIQKLLSGLDIHSSNAVELGKILGIVDKDVTYEMFLDNIGKGKLKKEEIDPAIYLKYTELRTQAKSIAFGLNYGKGAMSFAEEFKISEDEAQEMIDAYFEIYKGLKKWRDGIVKQALNKGYITLLSGRKRRFNMAVDWLNSEYAEGLWSTKSLKEEIARQAMNFPVQGGAHEVFEPAYLRLTERFKREGLQARLILLIHDDIVGECPEEELATVGRMILEEMPTTLNEGTKNELRLVIEPDFYESCWYSDKVKINLESA